MPSRCWFNARNAILRLDDYADASLIEGWAMLSNGVSIEHGWIVKDGKIIDPTLCDMPMSYFPGLEYRGRKEIEEFDQFSRSLRRRIKSDPFFFAFGWGGMDSPSMRHCFDSSMARCGVATSTSA